MPLIMQYFIVFKAFKALSYWVFVLFYLFFLLVQKNPNKTQKNPLGLAFLKKPGFFEPCYVCQYIYTYTVYTVAGWFLCTQFVGSTTQNPHKFWTLCQQPTAGRGFGFCHALCN